MIAVEELMRLRAPDGVFSWTDRDPMLYALALGLGEDPLDPVERHFVYEEALRVVPTFATVAAWGSNPPIRAAGVDYAGVVHAAQVVELHRPLPAAARVRAEGGMIGAVDKGDKGALIEASVLLRDADSGEPYATNRVTWLARRDGHFGGSREDRTAIHAMPARPADRTIVYSTRPDQAALYRLLGDRNPLHIDPTTAQIAGFDRPILHGLCTFGITCRAVLEVFCGMDVARIATHAVRFSGPVFPGDMIALDLWRDGAVVSFEARVADRAATVIRSGRTTLC